MKYKEPIKIFAKAQASAFIGGFIDYLLMIALTELLHIYFVFSIVISGAIGAVINFSINRHWTYRAGEVPVTGQVSKFIFVVIGSILLKSGGTYLFTTLLTLDYKISRIITDIIVSFGFNFVLQKYWVFKKERNPLFVENLSGNRN
jgi:putative flippase GtrA